MEQKVNEINIRVATDENNVPEEITWKASSTDQSSPASAMFLSVWDPQERNTLKIDLWDKEMNVDDMKVFVCQTLLTMSDSLQRATGDDELSEALKKFARAFGERIGI